MGFRLREFFVGRHDGRREGSEKIDSVKCKTQRGANGVTVCGQRVDIDNTDSLVTLGDACGRQVTVENARQPGRNAE